MAIDRPKYYWDACIWITLINDPELIRGQSIRYVLKLAKADRCEIWTSSFTLAEVYKRKCDGAHASIQQAQDEAFEDSIELEQNMQKVSVDVDVAKVARRLLR